jgi:hypothetical protein
MVIANLNIVKRTRGFYPCHVLIKQGGHAMYMNQNREMPVAFIAESSNQISAQIDNEGLVVSDRIEEVMMMCGRSHGIYEQIGNFAIALYVLGFLDAEDIMAADDIEADEAADLLTENFTEIKEKDLPSNYSIKESKERYLLVIGDPLFPLHFAVLTDTQSQRPYFSKLRFFGSGFDSLQELMSDFLGEDGLGYQDVHYFKKKLYGSKPQELSANIYIVRDDVQQLLVA